MNKTQDFDLLATSSRHTLTATPSQKLKRHI